MLAGAPDHSRDASVGGALTFPIAMPTEDPTPWIALPPIDATTDGAYGDPFLVLTTPSDFIQPGDKLEIRWSIAGRDLIPPNVKVEVRLSPPGHLVADESAIQNGARGHTIPIPSGDSEGTARVEIPASLEPPLLIEGWLLLDGRPVAGATLPIPIAEAGQPVDELPQLQALTTGVTVVQSSAEGPHPWVNFEDFSSNCPQGNFLPGTSGTCTASWIIYNDSNLTLSGYAGYDLALSTGSSGILVYDSAETEICRKGSFNQVVSCTLHAVGGTQAYKAQHYLTMARWTRTFMQKTIHWTLDPGAWWVSTRSSLSSRCIGECVFGNPGKAQGSAGHSINTQSGSFSYPVEDLSLTTSAGPLVFDRFYSSLARTLYSAPLGYGWTHNQDVRLILEGDSGGQKGVVWFKAHSANQYAFLVNANGTYTATSGVLASLTKQVGPPVTYTLTTEYNTQYLFAEDKKLRTWTDAQGHTLTYTYDANGRLSQVSADSGSRYLTLAYDAQGRLSAVGDHAGRQVEYSYDTAGDLSSVTDALGGTWAYTYDSLHGLTQVHDPRGVTSVRTEYEGPAPSAIDFNDYTITSYWTGDENPVVTIEDGGSTLHIVGNGWKKIEFPYRVTSQTILEFDFKSSAQGEIHGLGLDTDNNAEPTRTFQLYGTQVWGRLEYYNYATQAPNWKHYLIPLGQYYTLGQVYYLFFANDHDVPNPTAESYFSNIKIYDFFSGRPLRQFDGLGNKTVEIAYNPDGTTTVTDALGNVTTHTYDERRTLTGETDAGGGDTAKTYDNNFLVTSVTDPDGDTTLMTWSADGANLTQLVDAEGGQTSLIYDSLNNLTSLTDARGEVTSYTYDGTLLTSTTDAEWNLTSYTYTPAGFLSTVTDAEGNTTSYTYNSSGQRLSMTMALDETTTYAYDNLGRLVDTTDAIGRVAHNEYDAAGRLVRVTRNYDPARPQNDENQYNIVTAYTYDAVGNQLAVTDTYGRTTLCAYDNAGRLISTTDPAGHSTLNDYDDAGNLLSTTDALGRTTTYEYDELGRLVSMEDPLGGVTGSAYDLDGTLTSTTNALGHTTTYFYDDLKRVVSVTDALAGVTQTAYDPVGNVLSTTDAEGNTTTFDYDGVGRLVSEVDAEGGVTQHSYDGVGNRTDTIDPRGHATGFSYDALGRLTSTTDALGGTTSNVYDSAGNRTSTTDALDHITSFTHDLLDRLITTTDALSHTSSSSYDALGNVLTRTDPLGRTTGHQYDLLGRLTVETNALSGQRTFGYDAVGNQVTATDENGHSTTAAYDDLNRPTVMIDANGNATTTAYDAVGDVVTVTNALDKTTTFTYDALNRQTQTTDPLGNTTAHGYDDVGNRTSMTDALGVVTRYEYDGLGRLTAVVENYVSGMPPDAQTNERTEYAYDENGNRVSTFDGSGHETTFSFDWLNRSTSETDALGNATTYTYDAVGNRTGLTDAMGYVTAFAYDAANRLVTIDYPAPDADVSFTYDAASQRTVMVDGVGTTSWGYDALGRVTSVTDPFGGTVGYGFDAVGNRTGLSYPDGKNVGYFYDPGDRLTQVADWSMGVTAYSYDAANHILGTTLPNGVTSTFAYDDAGQLLSIVHAGGGVTLASHTYTYNPVGNRVQVVEAVLEPGATPPATPVTIEYEYDPLGRLTAADYDSGPFFHYTYDAVGNRLTQVTAGGMNTYTYDIANRLTGVDGVPYSWDANGNLLSDGTSTYAYDRANRLASVVLGTDAYSYVYNGLGDRLRQTLNGTATDYSLDLEGGLTQVLANGTIAYMYGPDLASGQGYRIGEERPGRWEYHLSDALMSSRQLVGEVGDVELARSYQPFGSVLASNGAGESVFGFAGEQGDGTGLTYLRSRYYTSAVGRFLTKDLWGGQPQMPMSYAPWLYAYGNPTNLIDPSGYRCSGWACALAQVCNSAPAQAVLRPPDRGYFEGISGAAGFTEGDINGREIMYDFATMTRARFSYDGRAGFLMYSISGTVYAGGLWGLAHDDDRKTQIMTMNLDYEGPFQGVYVGAGPYWVGPGAGAGYFQSKVGRVRGTFGFLSIGGSLGAEVVGFETDYHREQFEEQYADQDGYVNRGKLAMDILTGSHSPALGFFGGFLPGISHGRVSAVVTALDQANLYEALAGIPWVPPGRRK